MWDWVGLIASKYKLNNMRLKLTLIVVISAACRLTRLDLDSSTEVPSSSFFIHRRDLRLSSCFLSFLFTYEYSAFELLQLSTSIIVNKKIVH